MTTTPLTPETAIEYVQNNPSLSDLVGAGSLTSAQIAEGNINLLFRVAGDDPARALLIKQALPFSWRYPEFKLPVERSRIEYEMFQRQGELCPGLVPRVYLYDAERSIQVIEYLGQHLVMREGLMQGRRYPLVAQHVGTFMARTLFYTSDLYLNSAEKKALVPRFINPVLCKLQEDLVFTQPYMDHPSNRWTPPLDPIVAEIHADDALRAEVFALKERYMTHAQALIHNDLHTGSIMLNESETRVLDPEFAFFGPMGHDIGSYMANLVIGYAAQQFHAPDEAARAEYRGWLLDMMRDTWQQFAAEFMRLWEDEGNDEWPSPAFRTRYLRQLIQDAAGFGAAEIMRRTIGLAHVHDFWTISDDHVRAAAESLALAVARRWLMERASYSTIDDLVAVVEDSQPGVFTR